MDLGTLHVVAAGAALVLGLVVLVRRKGDAAHVRLGRLYVGVMLAVSFPVLFVHDATGRPGPFHALAVVSLLTTALGWLSARRRPRSRPGVGAHATLMAWSFAGVLTAGLAQVANQRWPQESPWPVLGVVGVSTLLGAVAVPRLVARALLGYRGAVSGPPGRSTGVGALGRRLLGLDRGQRQERSTVGAWTDDV